MIHEPCPKIRFIIKVSAVILVLLIPLISRAQQPPTDDAPTKLLDHLAGRWVMTGTLGNKRTTHEVDAEWVLKHEYLRFHEASRDKEASGRPAYEAIVFISVDPKTNEYMCLWLDNTAGGGLSLIARGKKTGNSIPLVFTLSRRESLHTTFRYDARADTWQMTIDDVTDGKADRFGDVRLAHAR